MQVGTVNADAGVRKGHLQTIRSGSGGARIAWQTPLFLLLCKQATDLDTYLIVE